MKASTIRLAAVALASLPALTVNALTFQTPNKLNPSFQPSTCTSNRRQMLTHLVTAGSAVVVGSIATPAFALDMDSFVNSELASDTKNCDPKKDPKCIPTLTQDEALCKYGQSGAARSEACKKVKAGGGQVASPTKEKSLGGAYAM